MRGVAILLRSSRKQRSKLNRTNEAMSVDSEGRRTKLAVGSAAHAVQDGLGAAIYVLMPILAQTFGLSYAQVGVFKGVKSLTQGVLETCSGNVVERIGEGRTLIFGLLLSAFGFGFLAFAPDGNVILACFVLIGVGTAFHHAPSSALISRAFSSDGRRGALGLYNSSGDVGKLAFSGGFTVAVGAGLAWQQVVTVFGIMALVTAVFIAVAMNIHVRRRAVEKAVDVTEIPGEPNIGWGILDKPAYCSLLSVVFLDNVAQAGILVFVPFLMIAKGVSLSFAMLATVVVLIGGVCGKAACGFLADRIGVRPAFMLVQILTAVGVGCVVVSPSWLAFALLAPLGIFAQGSTSITYGIVDDLIDPRRTARGYGLMYGSTGLAAAIGPYLFGLAGDAYGIEVAMMVMAIVALLAIFPTVLLREHLLGTTPSGSAP